MSALQRGWFEVLQSLCFCTEEAVMERDSYYINLSSKLQVGFFCAWIDNCSQVVQLNGVGGQKKKKKEEGRRSFCQSTWMQRVATICYFNPRPVSLGSASEEKEHLHKSWLIIKAVFFSHAPQINVSPVFTAYLTLSNRTVRDICHVSGWRRRLLHLFQPIERKEMSAKGCTKGLGSNL